MKVIVQKYGGSSLATPELITKIADRVISTKELGYAVVVVVSALGDTTDHLIALSRQVTSSPPPREMDMLLSVGERVSIALLAMAIAERGHEAISFTGSQVGIITNTDHTRARILEIRGDRIRKELNAGKIVVIAGYQGVSTAKEITTLGRGGSDTTAVALAAALDAEACEIMTDVDGVYTAMPQLVPDASRLGEISYDEMLDLADTGAQVLKASAVEFAKRHKIKLRVGSSFTGEIGTIITDSPLDKNRITAVSHDANVVLVHLSHSGESVSRAILRNLAREGMVVKLIWEIENKLTLLLQRDDLESTRKIISSNFNDVGGVGIEYDDDIGLLAVTGTGISFGTDIVAKVYGAFEHAGIEPRTLHISETKLCYGLHKRDLEEGVQAVHRTLFDGS